MLNDLKNLNNILEEAIELRNLNIEKLSELTDIPLNYLIALSNSDFSKLPPAPYVFGYLAKIAETLKIDANQLLKAYKEEVSLKTLKISGSSDKLPVNRYTLNIFHKKIAAIIIIILILIAICLFFSANFFLRTPKIEITNPTADNAIINNPTIKLSGKISPGNKLLINNEEILVGSDGFFEKDFFLQYGINIFEFKAKKFLGSETKTIRQIMYQP